MDVFTVPRPYLYLLALAVGVVGVVVTLLLVNAGLASVLAALVVPTIGVVYALQARLFTRVPRAAVGLSAATGGVAGIGLALLVRLYFDQLGAAQMLALAEGRLSLSLVLLLGVTVPLLGDLLNLIGPLVARSRPGVREEVLDGVILGVASGIAFAATSTVVNSWSIILEGYRPPGAAGLLDWAVALVGMSTLRPLVEGTSSGLIAAGVWSAMRRRRQVTVPVAVGLGGSVIYSLCDLLFLSRGSVAVLALHCVVLAVLVMTLRLTIREEKAPPLAGEGQAVRRDVGATPARYR